MAQQDPGTLVIRQCMGSWGFFTIFNLTRMGLDELARFGQYFQVPYPPIFGQEWMSIEAPSVEAFRTFFKWFFRQGYRIYVPYVFIFGAMAVDPGLGVCLDEFRVQLREQGWNFSDDHVRVLTIAPQGSDPADIVLQRDALNRGAQ